jgi:hypothetical protein
VEPGVLVAIAVAFVGGQGFAKLVDFLSDQIKGASGRRRTEVDAAAKVAENAKAETITAKAETAQALDRLEDALTDRRVTLELLSATRRIALDYGVPFEKLPAVELGD